MKTIYTDGDLLNEMTRELDFESIVYGARGQQGIGANMTNLPITKYLKAFQLLKTT